MSSTSAVTGSSPTTIPPLTTQVQDGTKSSQHDKNVNETATSDTAQTQTTGASGQLDIKV
jgi:hypothetical protein